MEQYCSNCQKTLPQDKFDLHLGYCRRNIIKCAQCKIPYDRNMEEEHQEQYHQLHQCPHCSKQFNHSQYDNHIKKGCSQKAKKCQYCDLQIPPNLFTQHTKQCEARTQKCELCAKSIPMKELQMHQFNCTGPVIQTPQRQNAYTTQTNVYSSYSDYMNKVRSQQPVQRVKFDTSGLKNGQVVRHQIKTIGTRIVQPSNSSSHTIYTSSSQSNNPNTQATTAYSSQYTTYGSSTQPTTVTSYTYSSPSNNSYTPSQYYQRQHQNVYSDDMGIGQFGDDPELQAALMASMGLEQSPLLYEQVQQQHQIEKGLKK